MISEAIEIAKLVSEASEGKLLSKYGCVVAISNDLNPKDGVWALTPKRSVSCLWQEGSSGCVFESDPAWDTGVRPNNSDVMAIAAYQANHGIQGFVVYELSMSDGSIKCDILVVWNAWLNGGFGVAVDVAPHNDNTWSDHRDIIYGYINDKRKGLYHDFQKNPGSVDFNFPDYNLKLGLDYKNMPVGLYDCPYFEISVRPA